MQNESPEIKYQKMITFATQWLLPTVQLAQMQGAQVDVPRLSKILADYAGFENFNQFYKTAVPSELESVPYTMAPINGQRPKGPKSPGQGNDRFGATETSRLANMNQQQLRAGGQSSPSQVGKTI